MHRKFGRKYGCNRVFVPNKGSETRANQPFAVIR